MPEPIPAEALAAAADALVAIGTIDTKMRDGSAQLPAEQLARVALEAAAPILCCQGVAAELERLAAELTSGGYEPMPDGYPHFDCETLIAEWLKARAAEMGDTEPEASHRRRDVLAQLDRLMCDVQAMYAEWREQAATAVEALPAAVHLTLEGQGHLPLIHAGTAAALIRATPFPAHDHDDQEADA